MKKGIMKCPYCDKKCLGVLLQHENIGLFKDKTHHYIKYKCDNCKYEWSLNYEGR